MSAVVGCFRAFITINRCSKRLHDVKVEHQGHGLGQAFKLHLQCTATANKFLKLLGTLHRGIVAMSGSLRCETTPTLNYMDPNCRSSLGLQAPLHAPNSMSSILANRFPSCQTKRSCVVLSKAAQGLNKTMEKLG